MITSGGKVYIKRYLAGQVPNIGTAIAFGIGSAAESLDSLKLQFEAGRAPINLTSYDFVNDKLIFKARLPDTLQATIYEVALFSQIVNADAGEFGSKMLTTFDSETEDWINPATGLDSTFGTGTTRLSSDSLAVTAAASTTVRSRTEDMSIDFSGNTAADRFIMAYNVGSNVSTVSLRLMSDDSNYYSLTFSPAAGYRINAATLGSAVPTGSPSWNNINMMEVAVTATSGGSATVNFDGVRIEDLDTTNPDYVLISREVLVSPFVKEQGRIQAVELSLNVSV